MKQIIPPMLFFICIGAMALLWAFAPWHELLAYPVNLFGIPLTLLGLGLAMRGSKVFEKVGTNIQTFEKPDVLITDGLFKISRNPMYLGFVLALLGIALVLGNLSSLLIVIAFFVITDRWYIAFEEDLMTKQFGDRYVEYSKRARRWL